MAQVRQLYRNIEVMLFNACHHTCAYCGFVTSSMVDYIADSLVTHLAAVARGGTWHQFAVCQVLSLRPFVGVNRT